MKRLPAHILFGAVALAFAIAVLICGLRLHQAKAVNAVVVAAAADVPPADAVKPPAPVNAAAPAAVIKPGGLPEATLARAGALAKAENYEAAVRVYETLAQSDRPDIRQLTRYNLGNLHLREAIRLLDSEVAKSRTLTELAKQNFRRVLEESPDDWDARYNLERALWLEPERDDGPVQVTPPPTLERPNGDKPELP